LRRNSAPGLTELRLPSRLRAGIYRVRVVATRSDGAAASDELLMLVGKLLPARVARAAMDHSVGAAARKRARAADQGDTVNETGVCHRFGPRRVDCAIDAYSEGELIDVCASVSTAVLRRNGFLYLNSYRCPRGKRTFLGRPKIRTRWTQAAPLTELLGR
jgi:hypothetical protein